MDSKDPTKAAIASPLACKLYGLEMLKENVQNKKNNRTRFMVMAWEKSLNMDVLKIKNYLIN